MKKAIYFSILLFCAISAVYSLDGIGNGDLYMTPYQGAFNFNLKDGVEEYNTPRTISDDASPIFEDPQIIALGGGRNYPSGIFHEDSLVNPPPASVYNYRAASNLYRGIRYTVECPQYDSENGCFYFVKQSNPDFRFPFCIQIGGRYNEANSINQDQHKLSVGVIGAVENYDDYKQVDSSLNLVPDSSGLVTFIVPHKNDAVPCGREGYSANYSGYVNQARLLFMNFAVFFPGEIDQQNGVIRLKNGSIYPIAAGNDYTAHIRITATVIETGETATVDIPFSAYYYPDGAAGEAVDTSASLFVQPSATAGNIDLIGSQREFDVATIDFAYDMNSDLNLNQGEFENRAYLFLSASENPFNENTQGFLFVKDDVGYGDVLTNENSIGYTVVATNTGEKPSEDTSAVVAEIQYDGTDSIDTVNKDKTKQMRTYHHLSATHGAPQHWHTYNGTVSIILDDNDLMESGYYRSYIYVHVVTNEEETS